MFNEDTVREVAGLVQGFAANIEQLHRDASAAIGRMEAAPSGRVV